MMPFELHWLRPEWWLALPLPILLLWWLKRSGDGGAWRRVCDPHLLRHLLQYPTRRRHWLWLSGLGWLLAILALAGPTWDQRPQPLYRNQASRVLVLDLSHSMLADDLRPSRLAQARYAINDILAHDDSRHALAAYAGDAFIVAPLTHDSATLAHLLAALAPDLMPAPGSRPARGLALAGELLQRAGVERGQIVLIGDAADAEAAAEANRLRTAGHRVSVLAVGTLDGAPLPGENDELLKDAAGNIVIARLDRAGLQTVASRGGGSYLELRPDTWNPDRLLVDTPVTDGGDDPTASASYWEERGPWLVLALLPLAALAFRRGWLLLLVVGLWPPPAPALDWNDLWQNREQRAHQALRDDQPRRARSLSRDPWRRGTAAYRAGDFEQAARAFEQLPGAIGAYNRGNALAQLGDYPQAIAAYDEALQLDPELQEAQANRRLLEQLLEEQQTGGDGAEQQPESGDPRDGGFGQAGGSGSDQPFGNMPEPTSDAEDGEPSLDETANETPSDEPRETPTEQGDDADRGETLAEVDDPLDREQQQALEQWLRRVPDDPGGLLRRKFLYQYRQRERAPDPIDPW